MRLLILNIQIMKKYKCQLAAAFASTLLLFSSCAKDAPNIYDMFSDVSVTFLNESMYSVVDYKEVNDGDSVHINFTITSAREDMFAVCVRREGQDNPVLQINLPDGVDKRTYTGVYKIQADRVGESKYRVYAINKQAQYIGDGYNAVKINVVPNFTFLTNREIYLPDSVTSDIPSYYSIKQGKSFSYANGQKVSADLDFGIYRTQAPEGDNNAILGHWYHLYSLSADPLFFDVFDISTWTKRETLFSNPANDANAFRDKLISSSTIESTVGSKKVDLKETSRNSGNSLKVGSVVYFKTPEGKYGALHIKQISSNYEGRLYFVVNVKIQN